MYSRADCVAKLMQKASGTVPQQSPLRYHRPSQAMKNLSLKAVCGLLYIFVAISALIFLPAWTFHYWQAWTFLAVFMVAISAIFMYLTKYDPKLLARRIKTTERENRQKIIRLLINLAFTAALVLSALDHRFAWSTTPPQVALVGDAVVLLGLLIIFFVFSENTFTAQTVDVEAGQKVISTGPYSVVRHPMYVGGLVFLLGILSRSRKFGQGDKWRFCSSAA